MKFNNTIEKIVAQRNSIILEHGEASKKFNYFDIQEFIDLNLFSTYIFITPRNIGKTYSGYKFIKNIYEETGEYFIWMRSTGEEIKNVMKDFKTTKYDFWPEHYKLDGDTVMDTKKNLPVVKFIALSTAHNYASIKGNGCFGIVYDEFLPRSNRNQPSYKALTDFIKTVERKNLLTVILMANATTLDSEILHGFNIWKDLDDFTDAKRRVFYKRVKSWDSPPDIGKVSTAYNWAIYNEEMMNYMYNSEFLKGDDDLVVPLSRLGNVSWYEAFKLNKEIFRVGFNDQDVLVLDYGYDEKDDLLVYNLTYEDIYTPDERTINTTNIRHKMSMINNNLNRANVVFTSYKLKDEFIKFWSKYTGTKVDNMLDNRRK